METDCWLDEKRVKPYHLFDFNWLFYETFRGLVVSMWLDGFLSILYPYSEQLMSNHFYESISAGTWRGQQMLWKAWNRVDKSNESELRIATFNTHSCRTTEQMRKKKEQQQHRRCGEEVFSIYISIFQLWFPNHAHTHTREISIHTREEPTHGTNTCTHKHTYKYNQLWRNKNSLSSCIASTTTDDDVGDDDSLTLHYQYRSGFSF